MSALAARVVEYDPLRDKSYRRANLSGDVVAWLDWLELGGAASRTLDQYERDLARLCLLYPGKRIGEFTGDDLAHTITKFKPGERRVRAAAIRSFFKWAKQQRKITDNPADYLPTIRKRPQKVLDVFTEPEIDALVALDVRDAAPLAILLDAGLRKAEARKLTLRHCSPESGQVVVIDGKGGRDRIVPMSARLRGLLADLALYDALTPAEHIFYAVRANAISRTIVRDKPVGEGTFARWWRSCLEQAGVRYRSPHTARHTYATRWRQRGLAIDELQKLLGHSSIATTADVYVHTDVADIAEHMALIEATEAR